MAWLWGYMLYVAMVYPYLKIRVFFDSKKATLDGPIKMAWNCGVAER